MGIRSCELSEPRRQIRRQIRFLRRQIRFLRPQIRFLRRQIRSLRRQIRFLRRQIRSLRLQIRHRSWQINIMSASQFMYFCYGRRAIRTYGRKVVQRRLCVSALRCNLEVSHFFFFFKSTYRPQIFGWVAQETTNQFGMASWTALSN